MSYLGIGTTDPNHPLEVEGQVFVQAVEEGSSSQKVPFEVFSNYNGLPQLQNSRQLRLRVRPSNLDSNVNVDMGIDNQDAGYFFISQPVVNQTNGAKETFVITQGKRVGIGTTNPSSLIHAKTNGNNLLRLETLNASETGIELVKDGTVKWKEFMKGSDNTLYFNNGSSDVGSLSNGGTLSVSGSLTTQGGSLNSGGTLSIGGSITGVGGINMGPQFQVNSSGSVTSTDGATFDGNLRIKQSAVIDGVIYATSAIFENFALPTSNLVLGTWLPNATDITTRFGYPLATTNIFAVEITGTERFRVHSNGYVGISKPAPAKALDVTGSIRSSEHVFTTNLYLGAEENRGLTTPNLGKGGNVVTVGSGNNGENGYSIDNSVGFLLNSGTAKYGFYDQTVGRWDLGVNYEVGDVFLNYAGNTKLATKNTGVSITGTLTSDSISVNGTLSATALNCTGTISATSHITSGGTVTGANIDTTGNYKMDGVNVINTSAKFIGAGGVQTTGTISSTGNITSAGTVQGGSISSTGNVNAAGSYQLDGIDVISNVKRFIGTGGVNTSGNVTSEGTVKGGSVTSTGAMACATSFNAGTTVDTPTYYASGIQVTSGTTWIGAGGVNTAGNVSGDKIQINGTSVINASQTFIGSGGVNTAGDITSAGTVQGGSVSCSGRVTTLYLTVEGSSTFTGLIRGTGVSTSASEGTYFDHDVAPGGRNQANHNHGQTDNNSGNAVLAHKHATNAGGSHIGHLDVVTGYEYSIYGDGIRSSTGFFSTSDRRLKRDIKPITEEDAMERILKLNPVRYQWNDPSLYKRHGNLGLIAQQTEKIVPEVIISDKFGNEIQTHDVMRRCEAWVSDEETEMLFVVEKDIEPVLVGDSFEFLHFDGGKRLACKVKKVKFNDSGTTDVTVEWKPDNGNFIDSNGKLMVYGRVLKNSRSVAYDQLVPLLIKATQHMNSRIVELEKQIKKMKEDN